MPCSRRWSLFLSMVLLCAVLSGCGRSPQRAESPPEQAGSQLAGIPQPEQPTPNPQQQRPEKDAELAAFVTAGSMAELPLDVLVLGLDASRQRSDVILAVTIPVKGTISVVSIPRDTRVALPDVGFCKINEAYAHGGAAAVAAAVQSLLGKSYRRHITLSFSGLEKMVDLLGGVPISVTQAMKYTDKAGGLHIDIKPGRQTLSGSQALHFLRFRADGRGDIGRIRRQQQFMSAWIDVIKAHPTRLLALADGLPAGVDTNLKLLEALRLAVNIALADREFSFTLLPGNAAYIENVSYWIPDN